MGVQRHLNRYGSVAAEQNHSSIKSYLGKGGTLLLLDNVRKIIESDHQHNAERCSKRNALLVRSSDQYKSDRNGLLNRVDTEAKLALSQYAYTQHCNIQDEYEYITNIEARNGIIYCYKRGLSREGQVQWNVGGRCGCRHSHTYDMQCEHELKADRRFVID